MESLKPTSAPTKIKIPKAFYKLTRIKSNHKFRNGDDPKHVAQRHFHKHHEAMEAFVAKLFASVSAVKSAYAELQMAQFPYNGDAIMSADEKVISELNTLSELKQRFLKKEIDNSSPSLVTLLLSEIQEQQSLMKMYEITMQKLESEIEAKVSESSLLRKEVNESDLNNKSLEKRLNSSGCFSVLDNVKLSDSNLNDFVTVLHYALRSIRNFVKVLIREMESANWDIDVAAKSIEGDVIFPNENHKCFAFESFVCREMFDGFDNPNFSLPNAALPDGDHCRSLFFDRFKNLKSANPIYFLKHNPNSSFAKFTRMKYHRLVHEKMEASFSGNLNHRETEFFGAFAEMARRVWLLHSLAFSFDEDVSVFQIRKDCRFSEVYMESVTNNGCSAAVGGGFRVAFTVVPGFKLGSTVIQSQVYLSPALTPAKGYC